MVELGTGVDQGSRGKLVAGWELVNILEHLLHIMKKFWNCNGPMVWAGEEKRRVWAQMLEKA